MAFILQPKILYSSATVVSKKILLFSHTVKSKQKKKFAFKMNDNKEKYLEDKSNLEGKKSFFLADTINFFKEVNQEVRLVEWPTLDRLFRQFVIVIVSLVFSALVIYTVDGIFASASKFLFEGRF